MDTWFQTNLDSPGTSRGTSPRTPRRLSDAGEGLFDTFDEDAQWNEWDGADRAPTPLRSPTPVAERAAASQPLMGWGSLLSIVAPRPVRAVAEGSSGDREQTSDAALERAAIFVQRLIRGKIARLDAAETTRTFKLLELYVRCTSLRRCTSRPCRLAPHIPRRTPHAPCVPRPASHAPRLAGRRVPRRKPLWPYSAASATGFAAGGRRPRCGWRRWRGGGSRGSRCPRRPSRRRPPTAAHARRGAIWTSPPCAASSSSAAGAGRTTNCATSTSAWTALGRPHSATARATRWAAARGSRSSCLAQASLLCTWSRGEGAS